jgi:hypothetical protein
MRYPPSVPIFTKRNALVGYLTLQAIQGRRRSRISIPGRKRASWKLPVLLGLGIVSAGVFAILIAVMLRRQREPEHLEGYAVSGSSEGLIPSSTEPEPIPAT